jgi:L-amino acid N-acyltransferase YncA
VGTATRNEYPRYAPPTPVVATAGRRDLGALRELKATVVDDALAAYPITALQEWKARFASDAYFADRFDSRDRPTSFFLTGPRERPAGMIALKERDGVAYVGDLYVRSQGRGIGHNLLRHVLREARRRGFRVAVADVFDGANASAALFRSEGFAESEEYVEPSLHVTVHRLALNLA